MGWVVLPSVSLAGILRRLGLVVIGWLVCPVSLEWKLAWAYNESEFA